MIERDEIQEKEPLVSKLWIVSMSVVLVISIIAGIYAGFVHGFLTVWGCAVFLRLFWVFYFGNDTR